MLGDKILTHNISSNNIIINIASSAKSFINIFIDNISQPSLYQGVSSTWTFASNACNQSKFHTEVDIDNHYSEHF